MPENIQTLEALLEQSANLHTTIGKHREQLGLHPGNRYLLSATATVISLEHAIGILTLMAGSGFTSTFALRAGPVCLDSFYPKISGALRV